MTDTRPTGVAGGRTMLPVSTKSLALSTAAIAAFVGVVVATTWFKRSLWMSVLMAVLPFVVYVGLAILDADHARSKNSTQRRPRAVLRISRAMYERLDPEVLQLFLTDRDFTSRDYERLLELDAFNHKKAEGASNSDIRRLPIVAVTETMLHASKHCSCSICLVEFEVGSPARMLPCFHYFHPACIDAWLKERAHCPICKTSAVDAVLE
ncbi:hypothetical protein PINS_up003146 [Pythium insidiosum]|nr:hypothetical protein PINS_up003146 [Pythium insidiosum]